MGFDREKLDAEMEALLSDDTFGDFDFTFADEVEVSEVSGVSDDVKSKMEKVEKLVLPILYNLKKNPERDYIVWDGAKRIAKLRGTDSTHFGGHPWITNAKTALSKAMQNIGKPIDEITRRNTYRARSPGVKPTTGIKLILPKTSSMAEKMQKVLDDDDPKKLKQMNNLVIGREDDGKEISLEFKTSASRERFRKMMNEDVELDETV